MIARIATACGIRVFCSTNPQGFIPPANLLTQLSTSQSGFMATFMAGETSKHVWSYKEVV
jgi:hypothetical protein